MENLRDYEVFDEFIRQIEVQDSYQDDIDKMLDKYDDFLIAREVFEKGGLEI